MINLLCLDFTQSVATNNPLRDKSKSAKKTNNADVKSISANTGYGNSKYSKKGNQHTLNNNYNNLNANNKKREINVEFSEEDDISNQNYNNNITNNSNNNLDFMK